MDSGRLPDDRSFTYSLLIRALVVPFGTLWTLAVWQSLAGVLTALIAWHLLVHRLGVPSRPASIAACLLAIEPAQLYYERMVMAETFGLFAFVLFVAAAAAYLATRAAWWLPVVAVVGLAAVSLRMNYLPVVLVISSALPLLHAFSRPRPPWRRIAMHTAAAVLCVSASHLAFQQWVGLIFNTPPGYLGRAGFMQLALVMPLVRPEHLERVGLPADFHASLRYPLRDPDSRMPHQWAPGGFVHALRERGIAIERVARPLARMALRDDPFGLVRMGIHTVGNYFRPAGIQHALNNDLGRRPFPDDLVTVLRHAWRYEPNEVWARSTPISRYFELGTWPLVACLFLLAPLAALTIALTWRTPQRAQALMIALVSVGLVLAHVLFVPVAFYRYLHPLPLFVIVNGVAIASRRHLHRH
jgi:hypothetical protein